MEERDPAGMYRQFRESARSRPKDTALVYFRTRWTYGELLEHIDRTARSLSAMGLKPGFRVAVALPNIPETVCLIYALGRIGATAVLLHPLSTAAEVADILPQTDCRAAFCLRGDEEKYAGFPALPVVSISPVQSLNPILRLFYRLRERPRRNTGQKEVLAASNGTRAVPVAPRVMPWSRFIRQGRAAAAEADGEAGQAEDIALILGSGGTVDAPKHIMLSQRAVAALAEFIQGLNRSEGNDGVLCLMPFFHGFGLCFCLHSSLLGGKSCILVPQYSDRSFARMLLRDKPSYLVGVPALYERMANNRHLRRRRLGFILGAACGGDAMSDRVFREVCDFLAQRGCACGIQMGYGLTECVTACAFTPEDAYKPGRIGKPFPGMRLKIASEVTSELPPGTAGEDLGQRAHPDVRLFGRPGRDGRGPAEGQRGNALAAHRGRRPSGRGWLFSIPGAGQAGDQAGRLQCISRDRGSRPGSPSLGLARVRRRAVRSGGGTLRGLLGGVRPDKNPHGEPRVSFA